MPNGTRSYYLTRSQPPMFCWMLRLAERAGVARGVDYLPQLRREHAWWMRGEADVSSGSAMNRVVRLAGGQVLNRYWDERDTPREEAWLEDVTTAQAGTRAPAEVYRQPARGLRIGLGLQQPLAA